MKTQEKIDSLVQQTKDFVEKTGTKGIVLGVSGGVDSAVSGMIAVKAVGKENVFFVHLPVEGFYRKDDAEDAEALVMATGARSPSGARFHYQSIDDNEIVKVITEVSGVEDNTVVQANVRARLRMIYLYGYANALNYLVIGTGNKTEHVIGYFTKYGDGATDFEPLADLWKWEVFELAAVLGVPQSILDKAPSAGLWDGQTDEDEIGITYKELDAYLEWRDNWIFCKLISPAQVIIENLQPYLNMDAWKKIPLLSEEQVIKIEKRIAQNEHKNHTPPIFKLA